MPTCARCGQPLREGAAFCVQCGSAVNQVVPGSGAGVSPSVPISYPVPAQAPATFAYVRLILGEIIPFFGQITNTILVDGIAVGTVQMNGAADFAVSVGRHTIQLVQVYHSFATLNIPVTRKSELELNVAAGTQPVVDGVYRNLIG